jgi:protease IV
MRRRQTVLARLRVVALALAAAVAVVVALAALVGLARRLDGGVLLGGGLAVAGLLLAIALVAGTLARRTPPDTVLKIDLRHPPAAEGPGALERLRGHRRATLRELVEALDRAAEDPRVAAVFAELEQPAAGLADAEELHGAIGRLRRAGKRTVVHASSLGDLSSGSAAYLVASAFGEVVLQPSGTVALVGLAREANFVRDALDRAGVQVQAQRRWEFKSAAERFTERRLSPPAREDAERLIGSQFDRLLEAVAAGRGIDRARLAATVRTGPLTAAGAVDAGLVDAIGYRDQALARVCGREEVETGGEEDDEQGGRLLSLQRYRAGRAPRARRRAPAVAAISCAGMIVADRAPLPLVGAARADALARAIRRARRDDDVRAILLRVDSPGGSYVASDTIWRELRRARDAGTPVVAAMGNVAASGGYFVAAGADRIVAQPTTVTGSIGVIAGKPVVRELKERLGIATEAVEAGEHGLLASPSRPWDEGQQQLVAGWLDRAYEDFTGKVAQARGLSPGEIDAVARGRVWSGADAERVGLVDILGGHREALAELRSLLGLAEDVPLRTVPFPPPPPMRRRLPGRGGEDDEVAGAWSTLQAILGPLAATTLSPALAAVALPDPVLALADPITAGSSG